MGKYGTSSRTFDPITGRYSWRNPGWQSGGSNLLYLPAVAAETQKTTSFRSSRSGDALDDLAPTASNHAESFSQLKHDNDSRSASSFDTGHTFDTEMQWVKLDMRKRIVRANPAAPYYIKDFVYEGPLTIDPTISSGGSGHNGTFPDWGIPAAYSGSTVDGVKAINATIPTFPVASLNTAIPELAREGIPAAVGHSLLNFKDLIKNPGKGLGGEHLNWQFGWKPLISDVKKACHAILESQKLLEQYERDSGRVVRRRFNFGDDVQTSTTVGGISLRTNSLPDNLPNCFPQTSVIGTSTLTVSRRKWFSGAYTYYFETSPEAKLKMADLYKKANHLLGLELTPDVLWNLAPWSWLSDWVVNIGDNLANANRFTSDNLVMKYGYLMHETKVTWSRAGTFPTYFGKEPLVIDTGYTRKERFRATPYGFGLTTSAFSAKQWSILGALGMARSPQSLHGD